MWYLGKIIAASAIQRGRIKVREKITPNKYSADGDSDPLSSNTKDNIIILCDLQ